MSLVTAQKLQAALPNCKNPAEWSAALEPALQKYEITSKARMASFLAQTGHESGHFNTLVENLNYSASRLMAVWPKRFPTLEFASVYAKNPEKLGNFVYANRIGNGPEGSGDGYNFRGRGLIQLTGRSNYAAAAKVLLVDLISNPDALFERPVAAMASAWFWASHGLNALADDKTDDNDLEDFTEITRRINGGTSGLKERFELFKHIDSVL